MAVYKDHVIDVDLNRGFLNRTFTNCPIGGGDSMGDRFGVRVFRSGNPLDLTGVTCTGFFIRANGTSVALSGTISGNVCYLHLPQSCYAVDGNFVLTLKLTGSGMTSTVRVVDGTVIKAELGTIVDPGSVVPDLSDFTALVERAEAAADTIDGITIESEQMTGTRYRIVAAIA